MTWLWWQHYKYRRGYYYYYYLVVRRNRRLHCFVVVNVMRPDINVCCTGSVMLPNSRRCQMTGKQTTQCVAAVNFKLVLMIFYPRPSKSSASCFMFVFLSVLKTGW